LAISDQIPQSSALDEETARAEIYGLLAQLFYSAPAPALLEALRVAPTEAPAAGGFLEEPWREVVAAARAMDPAKAAAGRAFRRVVQARMWALLGGGAVMVYPTSPAPAPLLTASLSEQNAVREKTMGVTAIAGLCGLPEVTIPAGKVAGAPVGLSLVGAPGSDRALLVLAEAVAAAAGLPA